MRSIAMVAMIVAALLATATRVAAQHGRPATADAASDDATLCNEKPGQLPDDAHPVSSGSFALAGLISPAEVSQSIFVYAAGIPASATVTYYLDDRQQTTEKQFPFWMGGQSNGAPPRLLARVERSGRAQLAGGRPA